MGKVSVRYIVNDVDAAISFYTDMLGFRLDMHPAPGFASLSRGDLQLLLNRPGAGGAGQAMPDGRLPALGGWNRIRIEVEDLEATIDKLKRAGGRFRNEIVLIGAFRSDSASSDATPSQSVHSSTTSRIEQLALIPGLGIPSGRP